MSTLSLEPPLLTHPLGFPQPNPLVTCVTSQLALSLHMDCASSEHILTLHQSFHLDRPFLYPLAYKLNPLLSQIITHLEATP